MDLAIELTRGTTDWGLVVRNNSDVSVYDVKVKIDTGAQLVRIPPHSNSRDRVLTIPTIQPGQSLSFEINAPSNPTTTGFFLIHASIISSSPKETPGFQFNNRAEGWAYAAGTAILRHTDLTSIGLRISVDHLRPALNGEAVFRIAAVNRAGTSSPSAGQTKKEGVQVKITLTPGLSFASSSMPDTTISGNTATWRVGDLPGAYDATRTKALSVPVNLSGNTPLETRCLTAEVDRVTPPDPDRRRYDDTATVCLGNQPPELIDRGEISLFKYVPCVGVTAYPCNMEDTLEIVAELDLDSRELAPKQRRDDVDTPPGAGSVGTMYLQPESTVIQVKDPQGRHEGKWRTASTSAHSSHHRREHGIPGAGLLMNFVPSGYSQYTFELSDVEPKQRPSALTLLSGPTASFTFLDVDTKASSGPFDLPTTTTSKPSPIVAEFSTLGLHKVQLTLGASTSGTAYDDTFIYTFYVGPIAELEVSQGGRPPGRQKGYVIEAINHGPDAAAGVLITLTGVPEGARTEPTRGRYERGACDANGLCEGFWTIDEMNTLERAREIGESEKETLTIFGDGSPITAAIKSTEDYSVVVDGTRHSTEYYDHIGDNNEAQITSQPGTGRADPNAPQSLRVDKFGPLALLRWQPPESGQVNGWPVTHYQVERNGAMLADDVKGIIYADLQGGTVNQSYRVRAVNSFGVPGPWSFPKGAGGPLEQPEELGAPTGLTAAPGLGDAGRIDLSWFAPSGETGLRYRIEHATDGAGPWRTLVSSQSGTTYSHTGLISGATYHYRVAALKDSIISPWAYVQATTEGVTVDTPGWPENLRFTSIDRTAVTLAWDPPPDDGGSRVTGYEYRVFGPCASGADAVCDIVAPTRVSGTSRRIAGLNREGTYEFSVRALNAVGAGDWSQPIQKEVGPATAGGGRVILSPSRLTVTEGGEAAYRVKLSTNPTLPLFVVMHWDGTGNENLGGELPFQQFKILLPSSYDTSGLPEWCSGVRLDWDEAYAWNVGVPITVVAAEDDDSDSETLTIHHDVNTLPHDCLNMAVADWEPDPVYDGMQGPALTVTERDND